MEAQQGERTSQGGVRRLRPPLGDPSRALGISVFQTAHCAEEVLAPTFYHGGVVRWIPVPEGPCLGGGLRS